MSNYIKGSYGESNVFCPDLGSKFLAVVTEDKTVSVATIYSVAKPKLENFC